MYRYFILLAIVILFSSCSSRNNVDLNNLPQFPKKVEDIKKGDISFVALEAPLKFMNKSSLRNDSGLLFKRGAMAYPMVGGTFTVLYIGDKQLYCRYNYNGYSGGVSAPQNSEFYIGKSVFFQSYYIFLDAKKKKLYPEMYHDEFMRKFAH